MADRVKRCIASLGIVCVLWICGFSQSDDSQLFTDPSISLSGQWFLGYEKGEVGVKAYNEFLLKRGYITVKKEFNKHLSGRITPDISVDQEGDGEGDIEMRLKYCYLRYKFDDIGWFTDPYFEFGLVHRPWLDFQQQINGYRVQGTMFLERNGFLNSADYGVTCVALLGGKIDQAFQDRVSKNSPGRYGSISVGVYNGGGYHAIEKNRNKSFEGRLSIRPFPSQLTGLQLSYTGIYGKGNVEFEPDFVLSGGYLSYETSVLTFTAMGFTSEGNSSGSYVDDMGEALHNSGYSFFSEIRIPFTSWNFVGRYDYMEQDTRPGSWHNERTIVGVSHYFLGNSKVLLDYDILNTTRPGGRDSHAFEIAVEVNY
ncbi:hypothetical protein GF406_12925 [candidate division KSB1 bacterium]|nr:hypothetical protein [candidate division KSB1 bacterium]